MTNIECKFVETSPQEVASYLIFNQMFDRFFYLDEGETLKPVSNYENFVEAVAYSFKFYSQVNE